MCNISILTLTLKSKVIPYQSITLFSW